MRINEISRPYTYHEAVDKLYNAGYKSLGSGAYGHAFQRKSRPNEILKIFSAYDDAYIDYLEFIRNHQNNKHFPKIIGKPMKITPDYHAVKLEKLEPVIRPDFEPSFYHSIEQYLNGYDITDRFTEAYIDANPTFKDALDLLIHFQNMHNYEWDIHAGNIMWKNNTLVFIDPVVY